MSHENVDAVRAIYEEWRKGAYLGLKGFAEYIQVWSFRGGKVIRLETVRDRAAALEAAGLRE